MDDLFEVECGIGLGTSDESIKVHLKEFIDCHALYNRLEEQHKQHRGLIQKMTYPLENIKANETLLFKEAPHIGNLLTYLYYVRGQVKEAENVNNEIRQRFSNNLSAMYLYVKLSVTHGQIAEASEMLNMMKKSNEVDSVESRCTPLAEYGYMLAQLGPPYYSEAISSYEKALELMDKFPKCPAIECLKVIWSYNLLQTYNRLMNHGSIQAQRQPIEINPTECFQRICQLLPNVIIDQSSHMVYQGRSYIELFDSYKKLRNNHKEKGEKAHNIIQNYLDGIVELEPEWWLDKAYELANHDGHVLERLGRHYRSVASNMNEFKCAETYLNECVKICPTRHVAHHQLAQCYRAMWYDQNDLIEAKLHKNPIRNGHRKKKYGNKKKTTSRCPTYSDMPSPMGRPPHHDTMKSNICSNVSVHSVEADLSLSGSQPLTTNNNMDDDLDEGIDVSNNDSQELIHQITTHLPCTALIQQQPTDYDAQLLLQQSLPKIKERTLYPNKPVDFGKMPKQFSKPDYYDQLRTSNPVISSENDPTYLKKAIDHMEIAIKIVHGTNCRYLTDLARLHICNKNTTEAKECFRLAKQCANITPHDIAYTYEQEALFFDDLLLDENTEGMSQKEFENREKNIMYRYREALINSVKAREKSRMAFYQLEDMLKTKIDENISNGNRKRYLEAWQEEYFLLHTWVENFPKASGCIHKVMNTHPRVLHMQWELVYSFHRAGDYQSAYQYMIPLLHDVNNLQSCIKTWKPRATPQEREGVVDVNVCLEIAMKTAEEYIALDKVVEVKNIYREVFVGLINNVSCTRPATSNDTLNRRPGNDNSCQVLLISEDETAQVREFNEFLKSVCGLTSFGHDDIDVSMSPLREFEKYSQTANVVIIYNDKHSGEIVEVCVREILPDKHKRHQPKVCMFENNQQNMSSIPKLSCGEVRLNSSPIDKHHLVHYLYKAIFVDYPKYEAVK